MSKSSPKPVPPAGKVTAKKTGAAAKSGSGGQGKSRAATGGKAAGGKAAKNRPARSADARRGATTRGGRTTGGGAAAKTRGGTSARVTAQPGGARGRRTAPAAEDMPDTAVHQLAPERQQQDPSDRARDDRLRSDLVADDATRSPRERHRERLTATEPEEDDLGKDVEDDADEDEELRGEALAQQDADEVDEERD